METKTESYTATNIRVLSQDEATERYGFAKAAELAQKHPEVSPEFIARLVQACQQSRWPTRLAELRYLGGDRSIQPTPEFLECYADLLNELRRRQG